MERTASGEWLYATYRWNAEETEALLAPVRGVKRAAESRPGVPYGLPSVADCRACHESGAAAVLGFSALQLSSDRDPQAPHATPPEPGSLDLDELRPPRPRRGAAGDDRGPCPARPRRDPHGPRRARLPARQLRPLPQRPQPDRQPRSLPRRQGRRHLRRARPAPSVARASTGPPARSIDARIVPGDPAASLLIARIASRDSPRQMPPLGTHLVDEEALALLTRWIADELGPRAAPESSIPTSLAPASEPTQENAP